MAEAEAGSTQSDTILVQARLERQQAYHRLNVRRIYLPLTLLGIIVLSFAILTIWQALFPDSFAGRFWGSQPLPRMDLYLYRLPPIYLCYYYFCRLPYSVA